MKLKIFIFCFYLFLSALFYNPALLLSDARFPQPDFETEYQQPKTVYPSARSNFLEYLDVIVLLVALSYASYIALKKRSRNYMFWLTIFSLLYFGFFREGCICAVGSIQNFTLALFHSNYIIPFLTILIFLIPLVFTLLFGRTFCSSVCPLGAIQEIVIYKPVKIPGWLSQPLSMIAYIYLGLAILFAATGSGFLICQYDPFISFFRLSGKVSLLLLGTCFLVLGIFIARPYCRFFCPYGVLLNWFSRFSWKHVTITPTECIQCRLCEDSCPFDAINKPVKSGSNKNRNAGIKNLLLIVILLPVITGISGYSVSKLAVPLSKANSIVQLADRIDKEEADPSLKKTDQSKAFRGTGQPVAELYNERVRIENRFRTGTWLLGLFLGAAFTLKILGLSLQRKREDYEPDKGTCFSCTRCFEYCPKQYLTEDGKRGEMNESIKNI